MNKQDGFTLAEVLIAIVIGAISIAAAFSAYNYFNKANNTVSQKAAINYSAREALAVITRDLRNAGYVDINFSAADKDTKLISLTHQSLENFDKIILWYTTAPTQRMQIEYYPKKYLNNKYQNTNINRMYLARKVIMNGTTTVSDSEFVPNIADFQIVFKDKNGVELVPVCDCGSAGQVNMKKVQTAEIYLTVESAQEIYGANTSSVITNAGGTSYPNAVRFSDKYHRETFFASVYTRNLAKPTAISESVGQSIGATTSYNK